MYTAGTDPGLTKNAAAILNCCCMCLWILSEVSYQLLKDEIACAITDCIKEPAASLSS